MEADPVFRLCPVCKSLPFQTLTYWNRAMGGLFRLTLFQCCASHTSPSKSGSASTIR
jgi:hypothetical protein